jgi:transcriptional regulator of aroF, aroG, tyrA and aromatic amino acid transport
VKHDWPGNVRELKSCIHRAAVLHEGSQPIQEDEITQALRGVVEAESETDRDLLGGLSFLQLSRPERQRIALSAMKKYGSARKAAKALGVSHQTIYNYLKDAEA